MFFRYRFIHTSYTRYCMSRFVIYVCFVHILCHKRQYCVPLVSQLARVLTALHDQQRWRQQRLRCWGRELRFCFHYYYSKLGVQLCGWRWLSDWPILIVNISWKNWIFYEVLKDRFTKVAIFILKSKSNGHHTHASSFIGLYSSLYLYETSMNSW